MHNKQEFVASSGSQSRVAALAAFGLASAAAARRSFGVQIAGGVGRSRHQESSTSAWSGIRVSTWWEIGDWHFTLIGEGARGLLAHERRTTCPPEHRRDRRDADHALHEEIRLLSGRSSRRASACGLLSQPAHHGRLSRWARRSSSRTWWASACTSAPISNYQAGYRFQHLSNGGIKEPNPGINFSQLYLQYNF